jgi:hypothetical protein
MKSYGGVEGSPSFLISVLDKGKYCNRFEQHVARQQHCKHGPTRNHRWGCDFYVGRAEQRLCNPFLSNGSVNTLQRVFRGVCAELFEMNAVTELVRGQLQVSRKLEEWVQKNF